MLYIICQAVEKTALRVRLHPGGWSHRIFSFLRTIKHNRKHVVAPSSGWSLALPVFDSGTLSELFADGRVAIFLPARLLVAVRQFRLSV